MLPDFDAHRVHHHLDPQKSSPAKAALLRIVRWYNAELRARPKLAASLAEQRRLAFSTLTKHASKVARGTRGTREEQEDDIELSGDEEEPTEPGPPRRMSPSEIATALAIDAALVKVLQSDGDILNLRFRRGYIAVV